MPGHRPGIRAGRPARRRLQHPRSRRLSRSAPRDQHQRSASARPRSVKWFIVPRARRRRTCCTGLTATSAGGEQSATPERAWTAAVEIKTRPRCRAAWQMRHPTTGEILMPNFGSHGARTRAVTVLTAASSRKCAHKPSKVNRCPVDGHAPAENSAGNFRSGSR
jgi:hypothetical protein